MPTLSYQLIEAFPFSRYADSLTIQRGKTYYKQGRVWEIDQVDDSRTVCQVEGNGGDYTVSIWVGKRGELNFDCDCPYASTHFCKHMVAAALELAERLKMDEEIDQDLDADFEADFEPDPFARPPAKNKWENKLDTIFLQLPQSATPAGNIQKYAIGLIMAKSDSYYSPSYTFIPCVVKAKEWDVLQKLGGADATAVNDLLEKNHAWIKSTEEMYFQLNPAGCLNLKSEAYNLLTFLQQYARMTGANTYISSLPMLARLDIPIFLVDKSKKSILARIRVLPDPVEMQVAFTREEGYLVLKLLIGVGSDDNPPPGEHHFEIVSSDPPWVMAGGRLFCLSNPGLLSILPFFPVKIPEDQADLFRENYLRRVAGSFPIQSDFIHWSDVHAEPTPRLYLQDDRESKLRASLRFSYGDHELEAVKTSEAYAIETTPGSWDLVRIHRRHENEEACYQLLTDAQYGLKRGDSSLPYGTFELRSRTHPFDFLMHCVPQLTRAGFEIYGEENLKAAKINRSTPTLRVSISSGIDWFDLKTIIEYGDQQISLQEVRKALKRGDHYIKLADGSVGQIPTEWLEKYKHLWNLAEETDSGFRVSDFHLPLIDSLLEGNAAVEIPPDLSQRRERLRAFEKITPQALPQGFTGELRPYQKHGFDWLHFLREYRFGGILADDMGLGKTIQVLAYLQSMQERTQGQTTSLLVVPKSLIVNWQRESEKFTPSLRFLEYLGNFRSKDTALFKAYDVVLTTYGTMLRDIDILHTYAFNNVILDESQAIKNPLAKSAKAARLLNAEHRFVMTGTPVENNTFELWSQFAFLNPGLLGNMEYFRREFANPIESGGDEQSAAVLRRLIYPFILRRTKEQVAPELPPRTERIIYADMDSAQKKLYNHTRERYRAELLGLIESKGMDDARFKILEGLLRLRQIAVHPALVDKTYRGEAPKFEILLETLETLQAENHKALIFSQFVETLKLVRQELDKLKIKYVYLDGSTANRQERVDLFQNDPTYPFFLISLKAGGVGLNLTAAEYVIHLDPWWNPAVEMQASDRAHRIGQDKPVFVYKIIARGTVEEKILQLQEHKRALVKSLIATETSFFKSLTKEDVQSLFD